MRRLGQLLSRRVDRPLGMYQAGAVGGGAISSSLLTSLVAYWQLEEASGTRADATGRGNDFATLVGTPGNTAGKVGSCLTLNGSQAVAQSADSADLSMGAIDFEIAGWVWLTAITGSPFIIAKWRPTTTNAEYVLYYNSGASKFEMQVSHNGSTTKALQAATFGAANTSIWYFFDMYHQNGVGLGISINGGAFDTTAHTLGVFDGAGQFALGQYYHNNSNGLSGRMDEVGVWKRLLTNAERTALYNSGAGITYPFTGA